MAGEKGKGGLRHRQIQQALAEHFRKQGKIAVIEAYIGRNVDILVSSNNKIIAIEIQLSTKHYQQIKENYLLGCNEVWVFCETEKTLNRIKLYLKETLSSSLFSKTRFYLIKDFIPHIKRE